MKLNGAYRLAMPRERAYTLLQDPVILARCMPGCDCNRSSMAARASSSRSDSARLNPPGRWKWTSTPRCQPQPQYVYQYW